MANLYFKGLLAEQGIKYTTDQKEFEARKVRPIRMVPSKRLVARIGLKPFDQPAPMDETIAFNPDCIRIATRQHVGAPASPCVTVGQAVQAGQKIGEIPEGALGAAIHSSINGTVSDVTADYIEIRRN